MAPRRQLALLRCLCPGSPLDRQTVLSSSPTSQILDVRLALVLRSDAFEWWGTASHIGLCSWVHGTCLSRPWMSPGSSPRSTAAHWSLTPEMPPLTPRLSGLSGGLSVLKSLSLSFCWVHPPRSTDTGAGAGLPEPLGLVTPSSAAQHGVRRAGGREGGGCHALCRMGHRTPHSAFS